MSVVCQRGMFHTALNKNIAKLALLVTTFKHASEHVTPWCYRHRNF